MSLTPSQAADSLKEIQKTGQRSAHVYGYERSSPYFIVWGVIWMIGYSGSYLLPHLTGNHRSISTLWAVLTVIGMAVCYAVGRSQRSASSAVRVPGFGWRMMATFVVIYLFVAGTFLIMRPVAPLASAAFAPLLVSLFYGLMGVWRGLRFAIAGAVVAALTLAGFFFLREYFLLWMAVVGGGSLVLAGLWLRSV
jgi:hypothetical protein